MLAQERLEQLKRQKTPYSTEELLQRGWQRYAEIRTELEAQHYGEFVMIEVDSGDYFVGATSQEALHRAEVVHPSNSHFGVSYFSIGYAGIRGLTTDRDLSLELFLGILQSHLGPGLLKVRTSEDIWP